MISKTTLRRALEDPQLLGTCLPGESWKKWRNLLIGCNGEPLDEEEQVIFRELTGRPEPPKRRVNELWAVVGRRGGKTKPLSVLCAYFAALCQHNLSRGERGVLLLVAQDRRAARIALEYIVGVFEAVPMLKSMIKDRRKEDLELNNGVTIEVKSPSIRSVRGPTYVGVLCDEIAFWRSDESANPDSEVLAAVRPGLATTGGPLFCISSPYSRRGVLWEAFKKYHGAEGDPRMEPEAPAHKPSSCPQSTHLFPRGDDSGKLDNAASKLFA